MSPKAGLLRLLLLFRWVGVPAGDMAGETKHIVIVVLQCNLLSDHVVTK